MNYILNSKYNSYGIIQYDDNKSTDYRLFLEGTLLNSEEIKLEYYIDKEGMTKDKLSKHLILESSGPLLVHQKIKDVLEKETHFTQFFPTEFSIGKEIVKDYYALNIILKTKCFDMEKSEFKLTNFDPKYPTYRFYYIVLKENALDEDVEISLSEEISRYIVINDRIKKALTEKKVSGIKFNKSIDLTPNDRSEFTEI